MPSLSLSMIVRNEERNLPECLGPVAGLFDEIVVVDTGSTDRTREVAAAFGARVFEFPWVDDFAAARNASLGHCTSPWVFWLDADDRVDVPNRDKLRQLFQSLGSENAAYVMQTLCLPSPGAGPTVVEHSRLFPRHPQLRWQYRVHEQISLALQKLGAEIRRTDIVIEHTGGIAPEAYLQKLQRNLRLLELENAEHPDDPLTLFNIATARVGLGRNAEALPVFQRCLQRAHDGFYLHGKLYTWLVRCHRELKQPDQALAACRTGRQLDPGNLELMFLEGIMLRERGDLAGAEACFRQLLATPLADCYGGFDPALRGYRTRHNLALVHLRQGRFADAESQWRAALAEHPKYGLAWLGLGDLYITQTNWPALDGLIVQLRQIPELHVEADTLAGFRHLSLREFAQARRLLEQTVTRAPQALKPRELLAHAVVQGGDDPAASERVLVGLLELDPQNAWAQRQLHHVRARHV